MYYFALFFILQLNTIRSNAQELTCFEAGFCVGSYVDGPDVLDANACLNACKSTPDCSWFSFDEFDARCLLSRDCLGMDPSCANSGCVYGQAQCDPLAVNTYTVGTNVNLTRVIPCTIIQSPNFPSPYPTDLDVISVIFFPDPPLEATSMTFLDAFDVNGNGAADCAGEVDKVVLTQCDERGDADGQLGKFCTSDADPLPVVRNLPSPENGVKVRFRSFSPNIPGLGFRLEICAFNQSTTTSAVTTTSTSSTSTLTASTTTTPVTSGGTSFTSVSFTRSVDNAPEEATDLLNLTPGEYVEHYFRFEYVSDPLDDVQATGVDLNGVSLVAEGQIGGITQGANVTCYTGNCCNSYFTVYPPLNSATSSFTAAQSSSELLFEVSYPSDGASNIEGPYRGLLQDEHGQVALASNPIDIQAISNL